MLSAVGSGEFVAGEQSIRLSTERTGYAFSISSVTCGRHGSSQCWENNPGGNNLGAHRSFANTESLVVMAAGVVGWQLSAAAVAVIFVAVG